ncbi:MAG: hypothetical protein ABWY25_06210 [Paenisporosarcina sp.]
MNVPSFSDRVVKVRAYLTDEVFGYTHWRAAQFCGPDLPSRHAVLVICQNKEEQDRILKQCQDL